MSKHTPGNWTVGKTGGTVVSDQPLPNYTLNGGHDHVEYYGGHLIAESIWRAEDARLIAAAPELLALATQIVAGWDAMSETSKAHVHRELWSAIRPLRAAIAKATGEQS